MRVLGPFSQPHLLADAATLRCKLGKPRFRAEGLMDWQRKNGLTADGVAGPDTFMAMGLHELVLLKQGTQGDTVKKLQEKLGIGADGKFGPGTERAVREYEQKNGLTADGVAGPATLAHMRLFKEITAETVKVAAPAGSRSIWESIKSVL